jgi:hypothetical protein
MTKEPEAANCFTWPKTKNRVTEHELILISPKTGLLLQIQRQPLIDGGRRDREEYDRTTQVMQDIVDHMNTTMGINQ